MQDAKAILCSRRRFAFMLPKRDAKKVTIYLNQDMVADIYRGF